MTPVAIIRKRKGKYHLISHKGKTLGVHSTREEALKQEQAIEIAKRARQLADGIGKILAATEHDERGRFTGPGGSGKVVSGEPGSGKHEDRAHEMTSKANKASAKANRTNDPKDHARAAKHHQAAAEAHDRIIGSPIHSQAASYHKYASEQHSTLAGGTVAKQSQHQSAALEHSTKGWEHGQAGRHEEAAKSYRKAAELHNKAGNTRDAEDAESQAVHHEEMAPGGRLNPGLRRR